MNTAVAAARLGAPAAFAGRISTDVFGERIWAHLLASGVVLSAAQRGPEPTARAIVELDPGPVFRFDGEGTADASMTAIDLTPLGPGPHLVHGGTLGIFRGSTAGVLAELVERHDGLVSLDPNVRPGIIADRAGWRRWADRWIARADLVKASDEDLAWMELAPSDLLRRGVAVVLRTAGDRGAEAFLADGSTCAVPAVPVELVDSVGAGDAFCGAVLTGLWERDVTDRGRLEALDAGRWTEILSLAATVAGLTVSRPGADPPRRAELPPDLGRAVRQPRPGGG
jgi:fructokinase